MTHRNTATTSSPSSADWLKKLPSLAIIEAEQRRRSTEREHGKAVDVIEASRQNCQSLAAFVREAWHVVLPSTLYVHNWHIDVICRHLEAITRGEFLAQGLENRLLINEPPGTMKSLLVNVFWGAWEWGACRMPHLSTIVTSFRRDACMRDGRRTLQLVTSDWFQARWPLAMRRTAEGDFENVHGGRRQAIPFGSLTNERADRLNMDDPHSVDTAESEAERTKAVMTFRESVTSRVNDPARSAIVVIMQRLHQNDISGTILQLKMPFVHLMFPMRFEPERACDTSFGRDPRTKDGELMFLARFPQAVVDRDEAIMGAHAVAGQHQQRPTPRGGLLFKRHQFQIVKAAPSGCRWVRGWDLAASENKGSPFTVGLKLGYHPKTRHYYIGHVVRVRVPNPEPVIVNTAAQDGRGVEIDLPQDPGAAGKIQAKALIGALSGYIAHKSVESGDKVQRAMPVVTQAEAGNISIVEGPWNNEFLDEVETFPSGYQDQIDALSRAFARMLVGGSGGFAAPIVMSSQINHFGDYPANA